MSYNGTEQVIAVVQHEHGPRPSTQIFWPGQHVATPRALTDAEVTERVFPHRFDRDRIVSVTTEEVAWTRAASVQRFTYELEELT